MKVEGHAYLDMTGGLFFPFSSCKEQHRLQTKKTLMEQGG